MRTIYTFLLLLVLSSSSLFSQTVVTMDMPEQSDKKLQVVALFDEEIPEGVPVVLGLMGYDIEGGLQPLSYSWLLNGEVISTNDIVIFTPSKGDDLALSVTDKNKCTSTTSFNLKFTQIDKESTTEISVYPTLVNDFVHIDYPTQEENTALVRIFNSSGKIVLQNTLSECSDLNIKLAPGVYFISVRVGVQHKVEKIIVQ